MLTIAFFIAAIFGGCCYAAFMTPDLIVLHLEHDENASVRKAYSLITRKSRLYLQTCAAVVVAGLFGAAIHLPADLHLFISGPFGPWMRLGLGAGFVLAACLLVGIVPFRLFTHDESGRLRRLLAWPAVVMYCLCVAPVYLLSAFAAAVLRFFGFTATTPPDSGREYDLETLLRTELQQTDRPAGEHAHEVKLFHNVLSLSDIKVSECIVPRTEIVYVDRYDTRDVLLQAFVGSGKSKVVVCDEDLDHVIGYVHSASLFQGHERWTDAILPISTVPESMPASRLMQILMQEKKSLAVVVDEFGGTTGIVSIEDVLEEVLGEIEDEHDRTQLTMRHMPDGDYLLSARLEVERVNEEFRLDLPESEDYLTIAGLILHMHERFPKNGERVAFGRFSFRIIRTTQRKIDLVRLTVQA